MKTFLMVLLTVVLAPTQSVEISAQDNRHTMARVYYSPKTHIVLDFEYTEEMFESGVFAAYAEKLLGIPDCGKENRITYTLNNVRIGTHTEADLSRPHTILSELDFPTHLLQINEKGLLVGYNLPPVDKERPHPTPVKETALQQVETDILHLSEEIVAARSTEAKAAAAAKQIFRLREARTYLLSGEVEHTPADGLATQLVLESLDKQEKQLVELFIGKTTVQHLHHKVAYYPQSGDSIPPSELNEKLYFSRENGFTDVDNIEADSILIHADFQHITIAYPIVGFPLSKADKKSKKKDAETTIEPSPIHYNIPGQAAVRVVFQGRELNNRTLPIAQYGAELPLPKSLFTGDQQPQIVFSEKTGNIVTITQ